MLQENFEWLQKTNHIWDHDVLMQTPKSPFKAKSYPY